MIQLDVSNAELVTLNRNDADDNVEVRVSFTDCSNVIIRVDKDDTVLIEGRNGRQCLIIEENN